MIKAVIFDFDGVLIDSNEIGNEIFINVLNRNLGLQIGLQEFRELAGLRFEQRISIISERHNIHLSQDLIDKMMEEGREEYREIHLEKVFMFPGAKELIKNLHENNFKIALGTNGSRQPVLQKLSHLGIKKYFSSIVTATDVENFKPCKDIFLKNAKDMNLNSKECVVIEDSITGITAAKAAGIKVIAVQTTLSKEQLKEADMIVESISEITIDKLKELGER
jgi:beta-phosphoglucomutase